MKVHAPKLNLCDCHGFIFIYMVHPMNDFVLLWLENITEKMECAICLHNSN